MSSTRAWATVRCVVLGLVLSGALLVAAPADAGILDTSWTAPTKNADGTPLTDLASYRVYHSPSSSPCPGSTFVQVPSPTSAPGANQTVSQRLSGLAVGTHYNVSVSAVDSAGNQSGCSSIASGTARSTFAVSPSGTVNFGTVNIGSTVDKVFTISNTAGGSVTGSASVAAPFTIVSGSPFTLNGSGTTTNVTVRFTPSTSTTMSTTLTFTASGDTVSAIVTGSGGGDTAPPTVAITAPTASPTHSTSNTSLTIGGTASDNVAVTQVTWANSRGGSGTASGTTSWTASGIALQTGSNVLTVTARDAAGNTKAASVTVTRTTTADTTAPTVSINTPIAGAAVSGTVTVSAAAADNVGVAGVQFKLDGGNLGAEVTAPPYTVMWNTAAATKTTHTLTAVARDAAGNLKTSSAVGVTVVAATTISLVPQDTFLNLDDVSYSADPRLGIFIWPANQRANAILMKFALAGVPAGATIHSATLNLYLVESDSLAASTHTIAAHKLIRNNPDVSRATGYTYDGVNRWTASTCCYNGVPLAQADISAAYDTRAVDKTAGYKTWNVTKMVQEWRASPSTNFGLLLNGDLSGHYRFFASTKNANTSVRPYLAIAYTAAGSPGDTTSPTIAITSPTANPTYTTSGTSLTLGGTASDNVGVTQVTWVNNQGGSGTASGTTGWTASGIVLKPGTNILTVTARDVAGNTATKSLTVASTSLRFVQRGSRVAGTGTTAKQVNIPLPAPTSAGNLLAVFVTWGGNSTFSCRDNLGNTYTIVDKIYDPANNRSAGTCYAKAIAGGSTTVTVAFSASAPQRGALVHELAGASSLDGHGIRVQNAPGTGVDAVSSGSLTTTGPAYIFGATLDDSGACPVQQAPGTNFTGRVGTSCTNLVQLRSEDRITSAAGSAAATFTLNASHSAITAGMAFR